MFTHLFAFISHLGSMRLQVKNAVKMAKNADDDEDVENLMRMKEQVDLAGEKLFRDARGVEQGTHAIGEEHEHHPLQLALGEGGARAQSDPTVKHRNQAKTRPYGFVLQNSCR